MPPRKRVPIDLAAAQDAAKAAADRKAERAPRTLTAAEVARLPGRRVLELGNAGHLKHLGVGTKPLPPASPPGASKPAKQATSSVTPKGTAQRTSKTTGRTASKTRARRGQK
jgi:hypothetical protein